MNNKALYDFINGVCKQDDSDIDESIAELTSAIHTLEKEKEKREKKRRSVLIDDFRKAYITLLDNDIHIAYNFDADDVNQMYDEFINEVRLTLNDFDCFVFN